MRLRCQRHAKENRSSLAAPAHQASGRYSHLFPALPALISIPLAACSGIAPAPVAQLSAAPPPAAVASSGPRGGGIYKVGAPYQVAGRWYVPRAVDSYDETGIASWYGPAFHGRRTANGEIYDMHALSAGHPTLPLPSLAYVTNLTNGRTILVRINDRGPYVKDRLIDLSLRSATELGFDGHGTAHVRLTYAGPAPLDGNDSAELRHLAAQSWYRANVADRGGSSWTTGTIAKTERVTEAVAEPVSDPAPQWSVATYRRQLLEAAGKSDSGRTSLGGPQRSRLVIGPLGSLAEAERMRHEVEDIGPVAVEATGSGPGSDSGPAYRVVVGPIGTSAVEAAQEMAGFAVPAAR
jgi:rare lipoprotein A